MRPHDRLFIAAFVILLGLTTIDTAAAPSATSDAVETCFGATPTIVGTGGDVVGTEGPDVVLMESSYRATTLGGDDLVCLDPASPPVQVDTGAGNDRVDTSALAAPGTFLESTIYLGPGADSVLGGPEGETVYANDEGPSEADRDVIDTAGGPDRVHSGGLPGEGSQSGEDVITLGQGEDVLVLTGFAPGATFTGGGFSDELVMDAPASRGLRLKIDNRRQRASVGADVVARWDSFRSFTIRGALNEPFTFLGRNIREILHMTVGSRWRVDVRMGGGPDVLRAYRGAPESRYDGGGANDNLMHFGTSATVYGSAGNDRLQGGSHDDTLIGGPGHDIGIASGGSDRCETEVRVKCER